MTEPKDEGFKITDLWAYVLTDEDGDEAIIAGKTPIGIAPLIAPIRELAMLMMPAAIEVASDLKRPVRLMHFTEAHEEMLAMPTEGESPHRAMAGDEPEPLHPERLN